MGFTANDVSKLVFKVQAGNVIDADTQYYWYQSNLENSNTVKSGRIIDQTDWDVILANQPTSPVMGSANSLSIMTGPLGALNGLVENQWGTGTGIVPNDGPIANRYATRLELIVPSNPNTLIAYVNYGVPASGRKWNWISPASVTTGAGFKNDLYR